MTLRRWLPDEPTTVLSSTDTCFAHVTEGGFLTVSWPSDGHSMEEALADDGIFSKVGEGVGLDWSETEITVSLAATLLGDVSLQPDRDRTAVVLHHVCPETRFTSLGPWDEPTARALLLALREALRLPRKLGALLTPSAAELRDDPRRFHGALIAVEDRFARAFEAPSFVGCCNLIFPPGIAEPDRATRVRAEGVWVFAQRPGVIRCGGGRAELHARAVEALPWASTLPAGHRSVLGLPLPERLLDLVDRGAWGPATMNETLLINATGWEHVLDAYLSPAAIEAETHALRALAAPRKLRLGLSKGAPHRLDDARALVIAKNEDGRMIALDYRRDPPEVLYLAEAHDVRGEMRWRRIAGDFDDFAERFLVTEGAPRWYDLL